MLKNTLMLVEFHVYRPYCPLSNDFSSHFHQLEVLTLHSLRSKHLERIPCASGFPILSKLKVLIINVGSWDDESLYGTTSFMTVVPISRSLSCSYFGCNHRERKDRSR